MSNVRLGRRAIDHDLFHPSSARPCDSSRLVLQQIQEEFYFPRKSLEGEFGSTKPCPLERAFHRAARPEAGHEDFVSYDIRQLLPVWLDLAQKREGAHL